MDSTPPSEVDVLRLHELMTPDEIRRPFRSVLLDPDERVRAKIGGYVTSRGRLTFWAPRHALKETAAARRQAARRLVESCVARARAIPGVRYLETKPAHDTPDPESFLEALRDEGFDEIATAHMHVRDLKTLSLAEVHQTGPELRLAPARTIPLDVFEHLFEACQVGTLDRAQRGSPLSARETLDELRCFAGRAVETELWSLAFVSGEPVGFALCAASGDIDAKAEDAVLLELGVMPARRRTRIGSRLVKTILRALHRRGAASVEALIDDENLPSLRLHQDLGFLREPGSYWTWRRQP